MARVFTIFNHGTDFHRDKDAEEVVTLLHRGVAGSEAALHTRKADNANPSGYRLDDPNATHLVCEGPGSDEVSASDAVDGRAHAFPGKANPIFGTDKSLLKNPMLKKTLVRPEPTLTRPMPNPFLQVSEPVSAFRESFVGHTPSNSQTGGRALGSGWEDNVYKAVWLLTHLQFERDAKITRVNLVGWSRGAVTCLMMANKLYELFGMDLEVNIFAIDPVPGGFTTRTEDMTMVPPNVRNLLVVLALDDDRSTFQPLDSYELKVRCPPHHPAPPPNVHFLPLPGNHSDVVFPTKGNAPESGKLCLHLAHKFLSHHGTRFKKTPPHAHMTPAQLLTAYETLHTKQAAISKQAAMTLSGRPVGLMRMERTVRTKIHEFVYDPWKWVNEHHRQCALALNINDPSPPALLVAPGKPYSPWQGFLPHLGIVYTDLRVNRPMTRS